MLTKYENGAEVDIEEVYRYENGAEIEAEAVYKYANGAEEEVWSAIKYMKLLENTFTVADVGYAQGSMHDHIIWNVSSDYNDGGYGTYYLEGDFTNPTVNFNWDGFFYYTVSDGSVHYAPAGSISLYTRTKSGVESYPTAVSSVGSQENGDEGYYSTTLSGNFDRIGFKVKLQNWGANNPFYNISIWNFEIDGKECIPSADCAN